MVTLPSKHQYFRKADGAAVCFKGTFIINLLHQDGYLNYGDHVKGEVHPQMSRYVLTFKRMEGFLKPESDHLAGELNGLNDVIFIFSV